MAAGWSRSIAGAAGVILCAATATGFAQLTPVTPGQAPPALSEINNSIRELYKQANGSLLRLEVKQTAASVLTPALKAEFDAWAKDNPGGPGSGQGGRNPGRGGATTGPSGEGRGGRGRGGDGNMGGGPVSGFNRGGPGGGGAPGGGIGGPGGGGGRGDFGSLVRAFLESKAKKSDREEAASLRGLALRIELNRSGYQGELSAVLLSADGYALIPTGLLKEAHADPIKLTLPDGTAANARFIGANLLNGFTIVQLNNMHGLKPVALARTPVSPGDLLLSITAGEGAASLLVATNHLSLPDERSGAFVFDIHGSLAAIAGGTGGFGRNSNNRPALLSPRLQREIDYITKNKKDIEQRSLGLSFKALAQDASRANQLAALTKDNSGVIVTDVEAKSLADKAGLKKGDVITSLDNRPLSEFVSPEGRSLPELVQLQFDLTTRTGNVPIGIIRKENGADKEATLQMPLE